MKKLKNIGQYFIATLIILLWIGFGIDTVPTCPDNAMLFVNLQTKEYFAPPCLMEDGFDNIYKINQFASDNNLRVYYHKEISGKELSPNPDCRDGSGFTDEGRSLSGYLLESIGLLPKLKSRWNSDGTWNK